MVSKLSPRHLLLAVSGCVVCMTTRFIPDLDPFGGEHQGSLGKGIQAEMRSAIIAHVWVLFCGLFANCGE